MRRIIVSLIMAAAGMLLTVALASADGGPHGGYTSTTDKCAACHRAHTAQGEKLLKVDRGALCLSCHDGTGSTLDTWDGASLSTMIGTRATGGNPAGINGALKGGGFVYARVDSGNATTPGAALANLTAGAAVTSAHVKFTPGNGLAPQNTIWGNGALNSGAGLSIAGTPLVCSDCHNPHGNGNYRILRPIPLQSGAGTGVVLADETTKAYTTTNYWTQYEAAVVTPWTAADVSSWCSTCHTRYKTASSANSGDAIFKYRHKSDGTSTMTGQAGSPYSTGTFKTQCLQCHVSHGSNAAMGTNSQAVPWPGGTARGNDSSLLKIDSRGTCVACHGTAP